MNPRPVYDDYLRNPADDLLGMCDYAKRLAEFIYQINSAFTVGIYGEWGSGKTTFVQFVFHFLKNQVAEKGGLPFKFVEFSAWPHKNADELWRALILRIGRCLYDVPDMPDGSLRPPPPPQPSGVMDWLANFLSEEAFTLQEPPQDPDTLADYRWMLSKLDANASGPGTENSRPRFRIDQQEALVAITSAASAALGGISPLVAGLSRLFGFPKSIDPARLVEKRNEAVRKRIESIDEFKALYRWLFDQKVNGHCRLVVFVDDLDRCMPDVALDILEAIKIFLDEGNCTFIVAADKTLIGQGLRLRYKELVELSGQGEMQDFYTRKGDEFFEKIIQLGFPLPPRSPDQAHRFIAAHFPRWVPASDIIRIAAGDNPRRLKQYCNWLLYKYLVQQLQGKEVKPAGELVQRDEFDKLIALHNWKPEALELLRDLAGSPQSYRRSLEELEEVLKKAVDGQQKEEQPARPANPAQEELVKLVKASGPLLSLFSTDPKFSTMDPVMVISVAQFADVRPQLQTMLISRDATFVRILPKATMLGDEPPARLLKHLLQDDLTRLIQLYLQDPQAFDLLHRLAGKDEWPGEMTRVEEILSAPLASPVSGITGLGVEAQELVKAAREALPADENPLAQTLLESPRYSEMLSEEVLAVWKIRESLPSPDDLLAAEVRDSLKLVDKCRRVAADLMEKKRLSSKLWERIKTSQQLRIQAAAHFLDLRKFAKLDALGRRWPELGRLLESSDRSALIQLEKQVIQPEPLPVELWEKYQNDAELLRFFRLRPYFQAIYPNEMDNFLDVSKMVPEPALSGTEAGLKPGQTSVSAASVAVPAGAIPAYQEIHFNIHRSEEKALDKENDRILNGLVRLVNRLSGDKLNYERALVLKEGMKNLLDDSQQGQSSPSAGDQDQVMAQLDTLARGALRTTFQDLMYTVDYSVEMRSDSGIVTEGKIELVLPEIERRVNSLGTGWREGGGTRRLSPEPVSRAVAGIDLQAQLRELGAQVFDWVFRDKVRTEFLNLVRQNTDFRFLFEINEPELLLIPWEALYIHQLRSFIGLAPRYSLLRYIPSPRVQPELRLHPPLRLLAVMANPPDMTPLNIEQEESILRHTLSSAMDQGQVRLEILKGTEASLEGLMSSLRRFQPHLFHFVGHGVYSPGDQQGGLVFDDQGKMRLVPAADLATLLADSDVSLAVLNGCDTGKSSLNDAVSGVAGALIQAGVPAAIATMRAVEDQAALLFSREFYRSFVDGYPVEAALVEARKAISLERWNWSAYALFTSLRSLDSLRLDIKAQRNE